MRIDAWVALLGIVVGCRPAEHEPIEREPPITQASDYLPKIAGVWRGDYGPYGLETVRIEQVGSVITATKVTGDESVPAGKPAFRARLTGAEGDGEAHVADVGYANPTWIPGHLKVLSADIIVLISRGRPTVVYSRLPG